MGKASCSFDGAWPVVELQRDLSRNGAAVVPVCGRTCITRGLPVASESLVVQNRDQGCAKIIRVILRGFGGLDAGWAGEEVLFERGRLGFIRDHAEVVAFEVLIGKWLTQSIGC